jgi:TonB family protein
VNALSAEVVPPGLRRALWLSGLLHLGIILALIIASFLHDRDRGPAQSVLTTKLVRLGKERPKELLPRKEEPPPPPEKPAPALVADAKSAASPDLPSAKDRIKQLTQVSSALDRLKQQAPEEALGSPDGVADGEVSDAKLQVLGDIFGTEIKRCLQQNYAFEGVDAARVRNRSALVLVRVDADGRFIDHRIEKGSGLPAFDRAVESAVRRCGKVSPPHKTLRDTVRKDGIEVLFEP